MASHDKRPCVQDHVEASAGTSSKDD
ncbi:uncharacterized protein G2W53_017433 [Senna tora]|uniref:Uncharacterized protein n=1 Tax=Senna tora TaxID=362788 RepID=A0A834TR91_9FABA|nr:uncharacterized protein G2W53_017433 [Senna tora]